MVTGTDTGPWPEMTIETHPGAGAYLLSDAGYDPARASVVDRWFVEVLGAYPGAGTWSDKRLECEVEYEQDMSSCPHYQGTGTCSFGCWEEPSCFTDEPMNGWPSVRKAYLEKRKSNG